VLLNDIEIARLAGEGMITPFLEELVRRVDDERTWEDGNRFVCFKGERKVISYGPSSYGYDLRLSPKEFLVFRHVPGTVVDPKAFSPENLEPVKLHRDGSGDFFVLPAHSYGLGVAREHLSLPADVTALFIGKCLTGDTRVLNTETGRYAPIQEFQGGMTASYIEGQGMSPSSATAVIPQGRKEVFRLRTKSGRVIRATASHPFLSTDGWIRLDQLATGSKIASPRCIPFFGNGDLSIDEAVLMGLMISEGSCHISGSSPLFTNKDEVLVELVSSAVKGVTDQEVSPSGKYGYRLVNRRGRGGVATKNRATIWLQEHGMAVKSADKFVPARVFEAPRPVIAAFLRALFSGNGSVYKRSSVVKGKQYQSIAIEYCSTSKRLIEDVRHLLLRFGIGSRCYEKQPKKGQKAYLLLILKSACQLRFFLEIGFWPGSSNQEKFEQGLGDILRAVKNRQPKDPHIEWDQVASVDSCGEEEVYDISVPGPANFVANDLIVHNSTYARCGVIANLTPGEAGWKGHLTLEFSNSSGADVRIYANEGVVQALFLRGEPCQVCYESRSGKYQNQPEQVVTAVA